MMHIAHRATLNVHPRTVLHADAAAGFLQQQALQPHVVRAVKLNQRTLVRRQRHPRSR
jgi:hypothetical protein